MEKAYYPLAGIAKFETMSAQGQIEAVYQNPGVIVYEVP
jgi:hypothetical protein